MIKVVAFFVWSPFTERDYHRFGLDVFLNNFSVYVFDCSEWLAPSVITERAIPTVKFSGYRKIHTMKQLKDEMIALSVDSRWAVFDFLGVNYQSFRVRRLLQNTDCQLMRIDLGALPTMKRTRFETVSYFKQNISRLPTSILLKMQPSLLRNPDIVVVGGKIAECRNRGFAHKLIKSHSMDYGTYLQIVQGTSNKSLQAKQIHILYLDEDMVFHQDYDHLGVPYVTTAERFFPAINRMFSAVEHHFGIPVVVAAHPRSNYDEEDYFNGRRVVKGCTPELVQDALFVLAHASTSISFAVLFNKPVVLLTSDDINRDVRMNSVVRNFADQLGSPLINIDLETTVDYEEWNGLEIDRRKYEKYKDNYLKTPGSPDVPIWELVTRELQHDRLH